MNGSTNFVPDYLLIGHIAHDVTPQGPQLGGTVSFSAYTAAAFGLRVAILTGAQPGEPLLGQLPPQVEVLTIPADHTTTFENIYNGWGRTQYLHHRAATLTPDVLPSRWREARLIHLGPIAYEVDPALVTVFSERPICVTPQGWMRHREPDGLIRPINWDAAEDVLHHARLTVLSEEDIAHNPALEAEFARLAPLLVVTRAELGGTLYQNGLRRDFPAQPFTLVDPTGAGDIFATTLHIALDRLGDLDRAIRMATRIAGQSVSRRGFASAPTSDEVTRAWEAHS